MKTLTKLTLKEYNEYNKLLQEDEQDVVQILELFGYDVDTMSISEFNKVQDDIINSVIENKKIKLFYKIGDKRFKSCLSIPKIKAGQFIDFQNYTSNNSGIECILSVFLIPQYKKWGIWRDNNYGENYDILEIQDYLLNNMLIEDVKSLSDFFLRQSESLLKIMNLYLKKKMMKEKKKEIRHQLTL